MIILACVLIFFSVTLLLGAFGSQLALAPRRVAVKRLRDLQPTTSHEALSLDGPASAGSSGWLQKLFGARKEEKKKGTTVIGLRPDSATACLLLHAGYRSKSALRNLHMTRVVTALVLGSIPLVMSSFKAISSEKAFMAMAFLVFAGFMLPKIFVRTVAKRRQHRMKLSLPDALDLLVVCVEAGMGLNQAIVKVSEELADTHPEIAEEFRLVNLEIRAGRTRADALRGLGDRTGVDDIISLAAMIIQTDKFGTSIARSLRVHSDSLRTERRQRAEEAAAKTTIKLIFPLLFCIFPALFVVILGPAAMHLFKVFGANG